MGRIKCGQVRTIARRRGWLDRGTPLPDDEVLVEAFERKQERDDNPTHQSLSREYEEQIRKWVEGNVCMTTIHQALVDQFGFTGSYSSVRRLVRRLDLRKPQATCVLDFAPGEAAQVDFGRGRGHHRPPAPRRLQDRPGWQELPLFPSRIKLSKIRKTTYERRTNRLIERGGPKTLFQPFSLAPLRRKSVAPLCRSLTPPLYP